MILLSKGYRAIVVDKDKPQWNPSRLEDVTDEMVEKYFEGYRNVSMYR